MSTRPVALPIALLAAALNSYPQHAASWVGSWACSQQIPEADNALAPEDLRNATLRQVVHLSAGGRAIRIHLSNAFGIAPLHLASVHVARPLSNASAQIDTATDMAVKFDGRDDVVIPAGAEFISDPLEFAAQPETDLTISIHYDDPPQQETGHPGSRATSYLVRGDLVSAADLARAKRVEHWYQLSAVDVLNSEDGFSVVTLGDSITDGHGATTNGNDRWPDVLAHRLQLAGLHGVGVLNQGIGGNHLLTDGLGPNALARFDRDVLAQTTVRYVIVLEGVNDLGGLARTMEASPAEHAGLVRRIIGADAQIIARAHAHNLCVIGATILPFVGSDYYRPDAASEADRQAVNAWIRNPGHFDALLDFDQVARDPAHPEKLLPAFDSGDHLHPSPAGYAAMANAVPLSIFRLSTHSTSMSFEQNPPPLEATTRMVIDRFNETFNRHDPDALASLLTDDTVFENTSPAPDGQRVQGKTAVVAFWRDWFSRNPDARFDVEEIIVSGDRAVVRWVYRKNRNAQPWHLRGVDIFTVRDGKVAAKLAYVKG